MVSGTGHRCRQIRTEAYENNPLAQLKAKGFAEGWVSGLFFYIPCFVTDPFLNSWMRLYHVLHTGCSSTPSKSACQSRWRSSDPSRRQAPLSFCRENGAFCAFRPYSKQHDQCSGDDENQTAPGTEGELLPKDHPRECHRHKNAQLVDGHHNAGRPALQGAIIAQPGSAGGKPGQADPGQFPGGMFRTAPGLPVASTMIQAITSTTPVRMAVPRLDSRPEMPILPNIEVRLANAAEPMA